MKTTTTKNTLVDPAVNDKGPGAVHAALMGESPKPATAEKGTSRKAPRAAKAEKPAKAKRAPKPKADKPTTESGKRGAAGEPRYTDHKRSGATWKLWCLEDIAARMHVGRLPGKPTPPKDAAWAVECVEHGHIEWRERLHADGTPCPKCVAIMAGKAPKIGHAEPAEPAARKGAAKGKGAKESAPKATAGATEPAAATASASRKRGARQTARKPKAGKGGRR